MPLPLLALGIGAAGSLVSGIFSGRQNKKALNASLGALDTVQGTADKRQAELDKWYSDISNTPALQSKTAKAQMTKLMDYVRGRSEQGKAQAALTGGSDEAVVANNTAMGQTVGDTVNSIGIQDEARKDAARSEFNQRQSGIDSVLNNLAMARGNIQSNFHQQNAANWSNAGGNIGDAAMNFAWLDSMKPNE
ncbi:MAG: hypothetical protein A2W93_14230 [Bacteroidetes bacterium GWF2_43_63]|nr:MAG: hypothetical protein A2W94_00800 [Bacteroidetes bacterium GWE2_42_42]OFY52498.1 MAG: hypothetical protein A2W93_14230 [Bacteroidetes bacterium GWF2_43_63]HBG71405.1 hypothetical protein [Bacteroidales bacterium]HCB60843.1 hypothetical protein [Bacteroidales bacterium]HCY23432.1 hypothetical protein [Bacteroidales bacterium]